MFYKFSFRRNLDLYIMYLCMYVPVCINAHVHFAHIDLSVSLHIKKTNDWEKKYPNYMYLYVCVLCNVYE